MAGYNDLATTDAHLLPEWDYEKNKDISPNKISRHSMQSVWWKCSLGHSWKAKISERAIEGKGCKVCEKDYLTVFPKLVVILLAFVQIFPQCGASGRSGAGSGDIWNAP